MTKFRAKWEQLNASSRSNEALKISRGHNQPPPIQDRVKGGGVVRTKDINSQLFFSNEYFPKLLFLNSHSLKMAGPTFNGF